MLSVFAISVIGVAGGLWGLSAIDPPEIQSDCAPGTYQQAIACLDGVLNGAQGLDVSQTAFSELNRYNQSELGVFIREVWIEAEPAPLSDHMRQKHYYHAADMSEAVIIGYWSARHGCRFDEVAYGRYVERWWMYRNLRDQAELEASSDSQAEEDEAYYVPVPDCSFDLDAPPPVREDVHPIEQEAP